MAGQRLPGESLTDYLKSRAATMRRKKNKAQDLRFRLRLLSDIYSDVVEKSRSYQVYMDWIDRWGLKWKELSTTDYTGDLHLQRRRCRR